MIDTSDWVLVPIPRGGKAPKTKAWQDLRDARPDPEKENVGVHLGPSKLVDIDLDCPEAIEFAEKLLPHTATFGRSSKSHWLYRGETPYRKFVDPVDGACLLEIRAGHGKQTILPGSLHPSGELIRWHDEVEPAPFGDPRDVEKMAALVWFKKHPGESIPPKVQSWIDGTWVAPTGEGGARSAPVFFDSVDQDLVDTIVRCCPDGGSRHDYRLAVAGAMKRGGIGEESASDMLAEAMADSRLGEDRESAVRDARAAVQDTYSTSRNTTGVPALLELGGQAVADKIGALTTPTMKEVDWLDALKEKAVGGSMAVFEDAAIINGLARLSLSKDSRLPAIWAHLKDSGFSYIKELKETAEKRAVEIRKRSVDPDAPLEPIDHSDATGMSLPVGYHVHEGILKCGEETIMHGELILLAKCPSSDGVQVRFAFRTPTNRKWRHSIAPYRALVDARGVLCLAEHGCNVSSLEAAAIVGYVRDFVATNESLLDRPVATRTGWHESGAFVWGRTIMGGPPELSAEYPADNQIASHYVDALHAAGSAEVEAEALREAVETLPTLALCVAASLSACWVHKAARPTIGVHLAGMGGKGKTRTLKIAGSVWGATGGAGAFAATGTVAGANTTSRALEIAASVRNDLPLLISDVRPFQGLTEVLHAILNGDARARATQRGGSTLGEPYRCGTVISEGELNVLALTTRQGFHRRVLELDPDPYVEKLWELATVCSANYGHIGPAFIRLGPPDTALLEGLQEQTKDALGHDVSSVAATLLATAAHAAQLIGADGTAWQRQILSAILADRNARVGIGLNQGDRVKEDIWEIIADMAPQIAPSSEATKITELRPWLGFKEDGAIFLRASELKEALKKKGHDAVRDALRVLDLGEPSMRTVSGVRVRCYRIELPQD